MRAAVGIGHFVATADPVILVAHRAQRLPIAFQLAHGVIAVAVCKAVTRVRGRLTEVVVRKTGRETPRPTGDATDGVVAGDVGGSTVLVMV